MTDDSGQPSDREIRAAVADRYGARARQALESVGVEAADDACCGPEEAAPQPLQFLDVSEGAACAADDPDCCEPASASIAEAASGGAFGTANYDAAQQLAELPESVTGASLGCGNPVAIAGLAEGEAVLDLGSGGGIDCFLAAKQVGDGGDVWGLDMTPDMIQLARHNAEQVGAANVHFRLGEIEDIPFEDGKFDAIMSNCVINLSTDKPRVFREAHRVLKPGGRLRVSDMVWVREVPEETRADVEQWAGCVAGALHVDEYLGAIRDAGFVDATAEYEDNDRGIVSAYVSATRPA
jgi:SAM-dependent methyltransferase